MTQLIERNDPLFFEQTCNKPYDRHHYKIVCESKSIVVESWEEVQEFWWNNREIKKSASTSVGSPFILRSAS